jgi:hypothetical protein
MPDNVIAKINGHAKLRAPPQLNDDERRVFAEAVTAVKPGHFEQSDLGLLVEYSRLIILINELWSDLRAADDAEIKLALQASITRTQKSLFTLCRLLKLSPSGRAPNATTRESQRRSAPHYRRPPSSAYDQMEAEVDDE